MVLVESEAGLVPASDGWFVINAREAAWLDRPGRGVGLPLTGRSEEEKRNRFPHLGLNLLVLAPGEPIGQYHWEEDQEGFLVLAGDALLLIEEQERPLRQWDFVHCPPGCDHMIIGAGSDGCIVLAAGSRAFRTTPGWGYPVSPLARAHGAGVDEPTADPAVAYASYPASQPVPYRGWLERPSSGR